MSIPQETKFSLTGYVRDVCHDMTERIPAFSHIDVRRIAFGFSVTRNRTRYGVWASITPLRFEGGAVETIRRGRRVRLRQSWAPDGTEYLYIFRISFPRMWNLSFAEKVGTIAHELLHISPEFNGDIRRFRGRCYAHGSNLRNYDAYATALGERWISLSPPEELLAPMRLTCKELAMRYGRIVGAKVGRPRVIPILPGDDFPPESDR
ncbi:MAG: hypothetical protein Q4C47_07420 [Planctomycetia bacterium]|nr:hypothetical protein [Planctomycetia bacterium]